MISKNDLRDSLKLRRAAIPAGERDSASKKIMKLLWNGSPISTARVVFVYISIGEEVDTRALITKLTNTGRIVVVPKIIGGKEMRAIRFPGWDVMVAGALNIPSPPNENTFSGAVDVALVPGLGFTLDGARLGYGAGYYDRWFSAHPRCRKIALAYDQQILERLPTDPWDIAMNTIVTPSGIKKI